MACATQYRAFGFKTSYSSGTIALLNDLGGSFSGATNGHVEDALVALNFNGTIDNEGVMKDAPDVNSSVFSWNLDAKRLL